MRSLVASFLIISSLSLAAQQFTISGYVRDGASGESLIGSTVNQYGKSNGTIVNVHGFYSLTLPKDSVTLLFSYVGFEQQLIKLFLDRDTTLTISLNSSNLLNDVTVSATKADAIHEVNQMSSIVVPITQIKAMPALLGENDIFRVLQLMPGIQSGTEGSTGLFVRGGSPDQNLILLDGVPVYNASHLFGFFSVFNADALNRVELVKGGFPARYGGRISSVIDISMKEGDMKKIKGEGSIGLVASKFTLEGPIQKDKTSFLISARRTYIDILSKPFVKRFEDGYISGYHFYDLNAKINHIVNKRNRIYLSNYVGSDKWYAESDRSSSSENNGITSKYTYHDDSGLSWGNFITAVRWNTIISPKLFANFTGTSSRYRFQYFTEWRNTVSITNQPETVDYYKSRYSSGINDWAAKADVDWLPNPNHYIRFGANAIAHKFSPGVYATQSQAADTTAGATNTYAKEFAAYVEDDWKISSALKVNLGVHTSAFQVEGKTYHSVQPRISSRYLLSNDFSVKASFSTMTQFIHLLTNAGLGLPTDLWVPSTARVRPQQSWQGAFGLAKTYKGIYEVSLEGYYKQMWSLIDYKDGASYVDINKDWQDKIVKGGVGESKGLELLFQRKTGVFTGWVGYTLSWTNRQFDAINFGKLFPYKYDNRHDINVALMHTRNDRLDFSLAWVFTSGNAVSVPTAIYAGTTSGYPTTVKYYEGRNSYRMRNYHRLDLSVSLKKVKKWGETRWTFGVYNVYNRQNPFYMNIKPNDNGQNKLYQYSLFPVVPSISYSVKF